MNKRNILFTSALFVFLATNCTTSHAQEEKSADNVQQTSLLSFLPQATSGTRTVGLFRFPASFGFTDYKKKGKFIGEFVNVWVGVPNTPIDWDNVPKIDKRLQFITKKDTPVDEGTVSQGIADEIGMLDDTKTLQENFIHAVENQEYKRVINCLALEQHFNKKRQVPSDKEPKNSLVQHVENNHDLKEKIGYMMCNDSELLLLVIQDRKSHQRKISDWMYERRGNLLYLVCIAHRECLYFHGDDHSLNPNIIQSLIDAGVNPNQQYRDFESIGTPLHALCASSRFFGRTTPTSQKIDAIHKLLLAGADISIPDFWGSTPLNSAKENGENEIATFLENFTMPEPTPEIVTFENEESFKDYMKNKPDSSN